MAYTPPSLSGFNANAPPDDGSAVESNSLEWARDIVAKIGTPLKTFAEAINTAVKNRFDVTPDYSITPAEISAGVTPVDFGKFPTPIRDLSRYVSDNTGVSDISAEFQAAVDVNKGEIVIPDGDYLCDSIITFNSGTVITGTGINNVRIIKNSDNSAGQGVFFADSGSSSAFVSEIVIRDLTLDGLVATKSFSEFRHLLSFNGVKDAMIERVKFLGYRGDGCYIGSGLGSVERHNINVTVQNCVFDGVNSDNRNGISVIDCDGVKLLYNIFRNTSKNSMPGPIDVEADSIFNILKNIDIIGNRIYSFSGDNGISVTPAVVLTTKLFGVNIKNNYIAGATKANALAFLLRTAETISGATAPMGIELSGNEVIDSESVLIQPFLIRNIRDIKITNNTFLNGTAAELGNPLVEALSVSDAIIENNLFYRNGNSEGAMVVGSVDNVTINKNTFDSPDKGTSSIGVRFVGSGVTTVSSNIRITNNTFIKGASQTKSIAVFSHTLTPGTNTSYGNQVVGGVLIDEFNTVGTFASGDATPTVAGSDTFFSNATGVTITRFDDGSKGQKIDIISKGATVYDTSTATRLIGSSVDITTADGDITSWVCEVRGTTSSVWRLTGFVDVSADNSAGA